eukprot:9111514-Ditylum_brightwellii.AAC.1
MVLAIELTVLTSTSQNCWKRNVVGDKDNGVEDGDDDGVEDGDDNGVEDGVDNCGKHLTHLSQGVDCHLAQRTEQNEHVVGNKDNSVDDGIDDGDDGADNYLTHLSQW